MRWRTVRTIAPWIAATSIALHTQPTLAEPTRVEFHFKPVPNAQIAVWLTTESGTFVRDVFVTQATGTLGIGNRPGRDDYLSSWRFPYGSRPGVLPVWGHARGQTYPQLVFHDDDPSDVDSLGWHENSSSPEPYFCRPLTPQEHDTISVDTMTCPSPSTFQSDKGRFSTDDSVYPPRGDLTSFEEIHDHPDVQMFSRINDLDAVSRATPVGNMSEIVSTMLELDDIDGPLTAWIEINLEHDENESWQFSREDDHYVDPRLSSYGVEVLGQPSIVYKVTFDPQTRGFTQTSSYAGYGSLDGSSGDLAPPDDTISTQGGSGADRLQVETQNDVSYRFGVFSYGDPNDPIDPNEPDWSGGSCTIENLPTISDIELEPLDFNRVRVHFTIPEVAPSAPMFVRLFYRAAADTILDDSTASTAIQQRPPADACGAELSPGVRTYCDVTELFGSTEYQIGVLYEDACANTSSLVADQVVTPRQEFATVDGMCFIATAAYGAPWATRVQGLRYFRDRLLRTHPVGRAFVQLYYAVSPPLADSIAQRPLTRGITRSLMQPLVDVAVGLTSPAPPKR